MTIEVHRKYLHGLKRGRRHELYPGTRGIIEIVSRHEADHYTALVLRVLDPDLLDLESYDVRKGEEPVLESRRTFIKDQINEAHIESLTPGAAPKDIAVDVITWKPDPVPPEKNDEA
jgi:hypothetical protein